MRIATICVLLLLAGLLSARAQDDTITLADVVQGAQEWAETNLDTDVFAVLESLDQQKVQQFFRDMQQRFQGEYVVSFASFQDITEALAPWLESQPETQPYGDWFKAGWDYLANATEIHFTIPPPEIETNLPPVPVANPILVTLQEMWLRKVAGDSLPSETTNYLVRVKGVFIAQKVPPELFWLAEVESGFDAGACSPAGAVGLFQLKPETAQRFGLSLLPFDQRLDPENNARASAQYLKYLHDRFQDWRLVIAAYNAGESTVQRLLNRYHTRDYDAIARRLPAETRSYVPRVEAILQRREGVKLTELQTPPDSIVKEFQVDE
jgi:membrane-bound lytic murein transglycosylase D